MAEYHAKSTDTLSFEVTKDEKLFGKLSYKSWFKFNAVIELANYASYLVEPKGFWGTTVEIKDGDQVLLAFQMSWNGEIVIQTYRNDVEKGYIFKHRGMFKELFVLTDQDGIELLVMKPHIKWSKMNYEYQITTTDSFENVSGKEILLMNSLHGANYYLVMLADTM